MKLAIFLSLVLSVFAVGCAKNDGGANKTENNAPTTAENKPEAKKAEPNECKICDFDFTKYNGELDKKEIEGLLLALNDEYLSAAVYESVNKKFNDPLPFANIVKAELSHISFLSRIFEDYKIPVPKNPWTGSVTEYESVVAACQAAVQGEEVNKELYDRLFDSTEREDITAVYKILQRASEKNHKPAFEKCAGGNGKGK